MHLLNIHLHITEDLRHRRIRLLYLWALLCLPFLFRGQTGGGALGVSCGAPPQSLLQAGHQVPCTPVFSVAFEHIALFFFDLEDTLESNSESAGDEGSVCKDSVRTALPLLLLSSIEQGRTKRTLQHCASSLQRRMALPLFLLYHAWKHFPA